MAKAKKIKNFNPEKMSGGQVAAQWIMRFFLYGWGLTIAFPLYWLIATALKDNAEFMQGNVWGLPDKIFLVNFVTAWIDSDMAVRVGNSLFVTAIAVTVSILILTTNTYVLCKYDFKFIHALEKFYFVCMMIPMALLLVPQYMQVASLGRWIEAIVQKFNPDFTLVLTDSLVTLGIIYGLGGICGGLYLLNGFTRRINNSFIEAAKIDGAGEWYIYSKVIMPFLKPIVMFEVLTKSMGNWNEYLTALTFLESEEHYTVAVGIDKLVRQYTYQSDYGAVFAGMFISMIPILILYCLFQKQIQNGMDIDTGLK